MKASVTDSAAALTTQQHALFAGENVVYLMGLSFVLGSLFTILVLILLDFMKRDRTTREPE